MKFPRRQFLHLAAGAIALPAVSLVASAQTYPTRPIVQVIFDNLSTSIEHIRAGKLRALAVTTVRRVDALPEVPTVAETVPGYEASSVYGVGVPAGTPTEVINVLNREINAALADARIKSRLVDLTAIPIPMTAVEFRAEIGATTDKWAQVVRSSGAKLE